MAYKDALLQSGQIRLSKPLPDKSTDHVDIGTEDHTLRKYDGYPEVLSYAWVATEPTPVMAR